MIAQTLFNSFHFGLIYAGLHSFGLVGVCAALPAIYLAYTAGILLHVRASVAFRWSPAVLRLLALSVGVTVPVLGALLLLPAPISMVLGLGAALLAAVFSARGLSGRLSSDHPLSKVFACLLNSGIIGLSRRLWHSRKN
jgi:hypothetical protein